MLYDYTPCDLFGKENLEKPLVIWELYQKSKVWFISSCEVVAKQKPNFYPRFYIVGFYIYSQANFYRKINSLRCLLLLIIVCWSSKVTFLKPYKLMKYKHTRVSFYIIRKMLVVKRYDLAVHSTWSLWENMENEKCRCVVN